MPEHPFLTFVLIVNVALIRELPDILRAIAEIIRSLRK